MKKELLIVAAIGIVIMFCYYGVIYWYVNKFYKSKPNHLIKIPVIFVFNFVVIVLQRTFFISQSSLYLLYLVMVFLEVLWLFQAQPLQALYLSLMSNFYQIAFNGIVTSIVAALTGLALDEVVQNRFLFSITVSIARVLCALVFVLIILYLNPNKHRLKFSNRRLEFIALNLSILVLTGLQLLIRTVYFIDLHPVIYLTMYLLILLSELFYSISYYKTHTLTLTSSGDYVLIQALETQLKNQKKHYQVFKEEIRHYQKLKHDFSALVASLKRATTTKAYTNKEQLLEEFEEIVAAYTPDIQRFSNNVLIDAMMQDTFKTCQQHHIAFEAQLLFNKETLNIKDIDALRLYNNLIHNAIEANLKIDNPQKRFIKVHNKRNEYWSLVVVENAFNGQLTWKNGEIQTCKTTEGSGFGLNIIKEIVTSYGGFVEIEPDVQNKVFKTKFFIPITR